MKKAISIILAMCIYATIAKAQSYGINLVEFSHRYYHALGLFEIPSTEAVVLDTEGSTIMLDGAAVLVDYDENMRVTKVSVLVGEENDILRLASVSAALCMPVEQITHEKLGSSINNVVADELGDYHVSLQYSMDSGDLFFIELKEQLQNDLS